MANLLVENQYGTKLPDVETAAREAVAALANISKDVRKRHGDRVFNVGDLNWVVSSNALSRAQNFIPNFDKLTEVRPFYIEYEGGKQPRPRLVKLISAHVDRGFVPVFAVLDEQGNIQPLPAFWKRTLGVEWQPARR
jgi:hypothetical protein